MMASLRLPAFMMFGLLLVGYAALDLAEVVGVIDGQAIVCLDMESEESEEERETQSEKEGKTEFEALLAARHRHPVARAPRSLPSFLPTAGWQSAVCLE